METRKTVEVAGVDLARDLVRDLSRAWVVGGRFIRNGLHESTRSTGARPPPSMPLEPGHRERSGECKGVSWGWRVGAKNAQARAVD
jgi:hypothetical protein